MNADVFPVVWPRENRKTKKTNKQQRQQQQQQQQKKNSKKKKDNARPEIRLRSPANLDMLYEKISKSY